MTALDDTGNRLKELWYGINENGNLQMLKIMIEASADNLVSKLEAMKVFDHVDDFYCKHYVPYLHRIHRLQTELDRVYCVDASMRSFTDSHYKLRNLATECGFDGSVPWRVSLKNLNRFVVETKRVSDEMYTAFLSGQNQIITAFGKIEQYINRIAEEKIQFKKQKVLLSDIEKIIFTRYKSFLKEGRIVEKKSVFREIMQNIPLDALTKIIESFIDETVRNFTIFSLLEEHWQTFGKANSQASCVVNHPIQYSSYTSERHHKLCDGYELYLVDGRKIDHNSEECRAYDFDSFRKSMTLMDHVSYLFHTFNKRDVHGYYSYSPSPYLV